MTPPTKASMTPADELEGCRGDRARLVELEQERRSRREAEEAFLLGQRRYRRLIEAVRLIAWEFDPRTRQFTYVSENAQEILGYPLDRWYAPAFWYDHLHPEDRERAASFSRERVARGIDHQFEYRMLRADGTPVWIRDITSVERRAEGAVALHGVFIDITERKRTDQALRESEQRYRAFIAQSTEGIWRFELEHPIDSTRPVDDQIDNFYRWARLIECNDAMAQMYGYERADQIIGASLGDMLVRSDPRNIEFLREFVRRGYRLTDAESHEIDRENRPRCFLNNLVGIVEGGELLRVWGTQRDITERKRAEEALARQAQIIAQIHDAVIETDLQGVVKMWNRGAERIYGYTAQEAIGRHISFLYFREDVHLLQERVIGPLKARGEHEVELRIRRKSGDAIYVHLSLSMLRDESGAPYALVGYSTDISERKRSEDARRESIELQRLMLSELDHRVRNNLASLAALIDISLRDKTDVREFAESIRGRVQAMSAVHSLLSRAHWQAVGLRSLIETVTPCDLQRAMRFEGPEVLITPRQVTALGMVLQELIANSLKHGALRSAGGRIDLRWIAGEPDANGRPLELTWRESGGPAIEAQPTPGQGTELIRGFVRTELRGQAHMSYLREGASHRFELLLDRLA